MDSIFDATMAFGGGAGTAGSGVGVGDGEGVGAGVGAGAEGGTAPAGPATLADVVADFPPHPARVKTQSMQVGRVRRIDFVDCTNQAPNCYLRRINGLIEPRLIEPGEYQRPSTLTQSKLFCNPAELT